jgi:hypothetical protein
MAAATSELPVNVPNKVEAIVVEIPRPPGNLENHLAAASYKELPIPVMKIRLAINIKRGIGVKEYWADV